MVEVLAFVVALAARLATVLGSGGFNGNFGYDPSVYYAAADALTFGRLPYRDFVLLHPPGIMLALTPFAELGRLTTDHTGFVAGNVAFMVLGSLNAALVVRVARGLGLPTKSAALGGLFYAVWLGAVNAEFLSRLEPLGDFFVLCGLLALTSATRTPSRLRYALTGAAFAAAASVKIWWSVPLILMLAWHLTRRRRGHLLGLSAGAAGTLLAVNGPFFLAAPTTMWNMVVAAQFGRPIRDGSPALRLTGISGLNQLTWPVTTARVGGASSVGAYAAGLVVACGFVAVLALAWRVRVARPLVLLLLAQTALLLTAPSWFDYYADFLAPAAALCVAAAAAAPTRPRQGSPPGLAQRARRALPWLCLPVAGAITIGALAGTDRADPPLATRALADAVHGYRCVMSNAPTGLIVTDVLSKDLRDGCRNWIDVTGRSFGVAPGPASPARGHLSDTRWQLLLRGYLLSGQAVLTVPYAGTVPDPTTQAALDHSGLLARSGRAAVYRTGPSRPPGGATDSTRVVIARGR